MPGTEGRGNQRVVIRGYRASLLQNEKVPEICCTTLCIYLTPQNCILKNSMTLNFILHGDFTTTLKKEKKKKCPKQISRKYNELTGPSLLLLTKDTRMILLSLPWYLSTVLTSTILIEEWNNKSLMIFNCCL